MIRGLHGLFYSSEPEALRAFLRDKLKLPHTDVGEGWLVFDLPEADLGVHPLDESGNPPSGTHDLSFYCDDIEGTVADLKARGVAFDQEVADHGYGFVTYFTMPGGVRVQLYEPKYTKRASAAKPAPKARKTAKPSKAAKVAKVAKKVAKTVAKAVKPARGKAKAAPARKRR
jgi:predicted enzyme related to lactoylglutathione lyase